MSLSEHWKETLADNFSDDNMYVNHRHIHIDSAVRTGKSSSAVAYTSYKVALWGVVNKLCNMDRIPRKMKKQYKKSSTIWKWYLKMKKAKDVTILPMFNE